jgi:hypothetical protein
MGFQSFFNFLGMEFMAWFTQICDAWILWNLHLDHHVPNRDTFEKTICFLDLCGSFLVV